jgi:hypothetical protein
MLPFGSPIGFSQTRRGLFSPVAIAAQADRFLGNAQTRSVSFPSSSSHFIFECTSRSNNLFGYL